MTGACKLAAKRCDLLFTALHKSFRSQVASRRAADWVARTVRDPGCVKTLTDGSLKSYSNMPSDQT